MESNKFKRIHLKFLRIIPAKNDLKFFSTWVFLYIANKIIKRALNALKMRLYWSITIQSYGF